MLTAKEQAEYKRLSKQWEERELNNAELFRMVELNRKRNQ